MTDTEPTARDDLEVRLIRDAGLSPYWAKRQIDAFAHQLAEQQRNHFGVGDAPKVRAHCDPDCDFCQGVTSADEIEAAATKMATFPGPAAEPIAKLLREIAALHEPGCHGTRPDGRTCGKPHGCDWCGDEDWPCNDTRNALAVARAILGGGQQ
jgi:hypothetical protein